MQIPFIGGGYTGRSTNVNAQACVNLFPVIDNQEAKNVIALCGTPGLTSFSALESGNDKVVRGVHVMSDYLYAVVNENVYRVTSAGVSTLLGTLTTNSGFVSMADNGIHVLIVDGTANGYLATAGSLTAIADADFPAACFCTFQDGYFIVVEPDTGRFWLSGLYDGTTWDALDFATAEGRPDDSLAVISNTHDLWIFGKNSTEVYYNSGDPDTPFQRISGALVDVGCGAIGSPCKLLGNLYWLSDKGQVMRNSGYQGQVISTPHLDYQISTYSQIDDARAFSYIIDGHSFYVLIFPTDKKAWVYDITTGYWHEWQSYYTHDDSIPFSRHRSNCGCAFGLKQIVGDYENGTLYELDMSTYSDNSHTIQRIRAAQTINKDRYNVIFNRLEIEFEAGTGLVTGIGDNPQAMLEWSDDGGHTWSNEHWRSIGKIGEYKRRAVWHRLGVSRNRVFRLTISDPVKTVILAAYADLEACRS